MGIMRLIVLCFLVTALTLGFLIPASRRALADKLEELRWKAKGETADSFYRKGEVRYQLGEFEEALEASHRALRLDPHHAPARALFTEVQFILGQGRVTPTSGEYDRFMR